MKKLHQLLTAVSVAFSFAFGSGGVEAAFNPVPVSKSTANKVYIHLMPWFESKEFSGYWGGHWTMANQNPDIVDASGRRQIASYYYPLIGPYASADADVIEYQLLLMKLSGVDGVLIDWPGTTNAFDYVRNRQNSEAIISKIAKVGLEFAVVYEDNNLTLANVPDKIGQARADMNYLRDNYFNKPEYTKINNQPLLLDFGPQTIQNANDWTSAFSGLSTKPYFLTLWYEHADAGANSSGEFAWVYQDGTPYLTHLTNFYQNATNYGLKMGVVAPGFNAFYAAGGWGSNPFVIDHNGLNTFKATLDLALNNNSPRFQVATWNDYGEGTNIEPTREYGYGYLTYMQQRLGVSNLGQADLELVNELFNQRKKFKGNATEQTRLDNVFYYLVSLQINTARAVLNGTASSSSSSSTPVISSKSSSSSSSLKSSSKSSSSVVIASSSSSKSSSKSSTSSSRSSSSVSSAGATKYRIVNRWKNTVLCDAGDYVSYSSASSGTACQWFVEDVGGGFIEIRNQATGDYMHIENLTGKVQASGRTVGWDSSKWQLENSDSGFVRVKNRWQSSQYIHVENQLGTAQHGVINTSWWSAQWQLQAVQ